MTPHPNMHHTDHERKFIMKKILLCTMFASSMALGACATRSADSTNYNNVDQQRIQYGYVEEIRFVDGRSGNTGGGAVVGAIIGGVVGHQIGSGRGNTAATVVGAAGGALIGNEVEKNQASDRIEIRVRLDSGERVTYTQENPRDFRQGERVRIEGGRVFRG